MAIDVRFNTCHEISFHFFLSLSTFSSVCDFIWTFYTYPRSLCLLYGVPSKKNLNFVIFNLYRNFVHAHEHSKKVSRLPDVFMSVHVHGVELLHLFLTGLLLHVLKHLISYVLGEDREQQTFLLEGIRNSCL